MTKRIVRIGSMSKSEKLDQYNLFEWVNRQEDGTKTRVERTMEYKSYEALTSQQEEGNKLCESLCDGTTKVQWEQIALFLERNYPNHYAQIVGGVDDDGFVKVGRKRGHFFYYWKFCSDLKDRETYEKLYGTSSKTTRADQPRALGELLSPDADIWDFSKAERILVLGHWESLLRHDWIDDLLGRAQSYQDELEKRETLRSEYHRRLLEKADVIGITTTGLARYAPLIDRVEAKTLICEEAGEVLEVLPLNLVSYNLLKSHTLTALLPSIQHCILIGNTLGYVLTRRGSHAIAATHPES